MKKSTETKTEKKPTKSKTTTKTKKPATKKKTTKKKTDIDLTIAPVNEVTPDSGEKATTIFLDKSSPKVEETLKDELLKFEYDETPEEKTPEEIAAELAADRKDAKEIAATIDSASTMFMDVGTGMKEQDKNWSDRKIKNFDNEQIESLAAVADVVENMKSEAEKSQEDEVNIAQTEDIAKKIKRLQTLEVIADIIIALSLIGIIIVMVL